MSQLVHIKTCVSPLWVVYSKSNMTAEAPIDLDNIKFEDEDLYGEQIKIETFGDDSSTETETFFTPTKQHKLYSKPCYRRHPEDADTEDRVLVSLVDGGMSWE